MTTPTWAQAKNLASGGGLPQDTLAERMVSLLASLATGQNPDGTPYNAPVTAAPYATPAANILNGFQSFAATTAATTLITIPAGRTWVGVIGANCSVGVAAASATAGQARAVLSVAGTSVTPAAGSVAAAEAKAGANGAAGTVGSQGQGAVKVPLTVIAAAGQTALVQVATTQAGTSSVVDAYAIGQLL